MRQVLAWAMDHDAAIALRLAVALAPWWSLRGRATGQYLLLGEAAGRAPAGSDRWCAAQYWLGHAALSWGDMAEALGYFTVVRDAIGDRPPSRVLADCLAGRSAALSNLGRHAEAVHNGRRALALARELGYPAGEALALERLAVAAFFADDLGEAQRLARQAQQVTADIPGWIARLWSQLSTLMLTESGDLAAAERICAAGLARCRDAGDVVTLVRLLIWMEILDLRAGRTKDAAAHLREALQNDAQTGGGMELLNELDCCGHLCAATGRCAEALTLWAAYAAFQRGAEPDPPLYVRRRRESLREARQALGPARTRAAEERGAAMSMSAAAEYALMLTAPGAPAAAPGPGKLSARERELVTLVAQGRTDAQIAAQLYISIRTVRSHLDRIRDKTGCRRRADLTRLALAEGLV
jgi:DNA-binding CsgD family transcriptional regulator/tetratricopeptide (TPR) repeat protein